MKVKSLSRVRLFVTPWTAAHQAPPSMGFSRQEHWNGCHRFLQVYCSCATTFESWLIFVFLLLWPNRPGFSKPSWACAAPRKISEYFPPPLTKILFQVFWEEATICILTGLPDHFEKVLWRLYSSITLYHNKWWATWNFSTSVVLNTSLYAVSFHKGFILLWYRQV